MQDEINIFKHLKGGSIKGYNDKSIAVRNIKQNELDSRLIYNEGIHIPEYKKHIEICRYFYEKGIYDIDKSNL